MDKLIFKIARKFTVLGWFYLFSIPLNASDIGKNSESNFAAVKKILELPDEKIDIGLGNLLIGKFTIQN